MHDPDIILVDASDTVGIAQSIDRSAVVEIIDHRSVHEGEKFPNAKLQIDLVGSAATLVAERWKVSVIQWSKPTANNGRTTIFHARA